MLFDVTDLFVYYHYEIRALVICVSTKVVTLYVMLLIFIGQVIWLFDAFLPRDALLSTVYAVVVCLCVCVCVRHTPVLYQNG